MVEFKMPAWPTLFPSYLTIKNDLPYPFGNLYKKGPKKLDYYNHEAADTRLGKHLETRDLYHE